MSTSYDYWQSIKFPFFRATNGTITCTLPLYFIMPPNLRAPLGAEGPETTGRQISPFESAWLCPDRSAPEYAKVRQTIREHHHSPLVTKGFRR